MAKKRKREQWKDRRIYYGPENAETSMWWPVKVKPAPHPVSFDGKVAHAFEGYPGVTIGCAMSNMVRENGKATTIGFDVVIASFSKSTAVLIFKRKRNGEPGWGYLYHHNYGFIVEHNDKRTLKRLVRVRPEMMEREFTLNPPRTGIKAGKPRTGPRKRKDDPDKGLVHIGALARAVAAKLMHPAVARQLQQVADDARGKSE